MDQDFAQIGFALSVVTIVIVLLVLLLFNLMLTGRNRKLKHHAELLQVQLKLREEVAAIRLEVAEATLGDVSRDLHDEVGQLLTFCILQLENMADTPESKKQGMINEIKQSVRDALDAIRSISRGLNPDMVNSQGLIISLEQLLERATSRTNKKFRMEVAPGFRIKNSSNPIIVFRIIRECLTNAIRHGHADEVLISMKPQGELAEIIIHDNGIGINKEISPGGLGFKTMQHYAGLMNGELNFKSGNDDGTKIILTFPNTSI